MGKFAPDAVMDAALAYIATADTLLVCSGSGPTDYAGAVSAALADVTLTPGNGNGDFTIADGDVSGRKLTVAQQAAIDIDTSGTATHIALVEGGDTLIYVTTCTSQALVDTGTVTVPAFDIEIADPS